MNSMSSRNTGLEDILNQYDNLLSRLGVDYLGDVYDSDANFRIPLILKEGCFYIDLDTHKYIKENGLKADFLTVIGNRLYGTKDAKEATMPGEEETVAFHEYCKDMYYYELLTIASKKMHASHPKVVEKIWAEIGERFKLSKQQSQGLRVVCYQPTSPNYEIEDDEEKYFDGSDAIKECRLAPFLEELQEYSKHISCSHDDCIVVGSNINRCRKLHELFDNGDYFLE